MKLRLLLFVCSIMLTTTAFTQKPVYGIKFGFNAAKWAIDGSYSFQNNYRIGLLAGVNVEVPVTGAVSAQGELLFSMFGSTFKDDGDIGKYKTNYLLLPVMGRYSFDNGFSVMAGPQVGYLLSAKSYLDGDKYDFKDEVKKMDVFFVLGAEYKLPNGIEVGFRYQHGLLNFEKGADAPLHNRGIAITGTYKLKQPLREVLNTLFK